MKPADLIANYQACIDTRAELVTQRAAFDKALAARDSAEVTRQAIDEGLKAWVTGAFGLNSAEAQEFGFAPRKLGTKSAATKATAAELSLATRRARGTRGKRQREKIKGTLPVPAAPAAPVTTTPAAPPAASVTTSSNGVATTTAPTNGVAAQH